MEEQTPGAHVPPTSAEVRELLEVRNRFGRLPRRDDGRCDACGAEPALDVDLPPHRRRLGARCLTDHVLSCHGAMTSLAAVWSGYVELTDNLQKLLDDRTVALQAARAAELEATEEAESLLRLLEVPMQDELADAIRVLEGELVIERARLAELRERQKLLEDTNDELVKSLGDANQELIETRRCAAELRGELEACDEVSKEISAMLMIFAPPGLVRPEDDNAARGRLP